MRIIGLDLGEKRIGVAAAEEEAPVAIPITTLHVDGDAVEAIERLVDEHRAGALVVGLPLSMSGATGQQAQRVMSVVEALSERLAIPVHTWDERLTTAQALRSRPGSDRKRRRSSSDNRDAIAATILLQAYLDWRGR